MIRLMKDGERWLMFTRPGSAWRRRKDFASPFLEHAVRTAEQWYGAPAEGWRLDKRTDETRGGSGMPSQPDVSSDPVAAYLRARAVSETFKAKTAQLEYEERAGKLIQATKAGEYAVHWSAIVGDALAAFADRVAPLVAAAKSEAEIHRILVGETNALRRKTAKAISDAGY
jgi:hypothetical protein